MQETFKDEFKLIKTKYSSKLDVYNAWSVSYHKGDYHAPHNHGSIGYCGILYLDMHKNSPVTTYIQPWNNEKDETVLSSSNVRDLLKAGDFKEAEKMLGHKWLIKGTVVSGDKRGREIGFPTANLEVNDFLQINFGVYAVKVEIDGMSYNGVSNYGIRPTFDGEKLLLETYLFDFSKDIYGKDIVVSFIEFIRKEKKFDGIDLLKEQIALDSKKAIKILDK